MWFLIEEVSSPHNVDMWRFHWLILKLRWILKGGLLEIGQRIARVSGSYIPSGQNSTPSEILNKASAALASCFLHNDVISAGATNTWHESGQIWYASTSLSTQRSAIHGGGGPHVEESFVKVLKVKPIFITTPFECLIGKHRFKPSPQCLGKIHRYLINWNIF